MLRNPFVDAERYIQLRKRFSPRSWGDSIMVLNELLVSPFVTLFLALLGKVTLISAIPTVVSTFRAWKEWLEYNDLKYAVQRMYLITMANGGPFIVTNDSDYMPYVWADGVMRVSQRH